MKTTPGKFQFGEWNARFVFRYSGWILGVIALACILSFPFIRKLELHANFLELLPADSPSVVNLRELTNQVGGTTYLMGVIESPNERTAVETAEKLAKRASTFQGVDYVDNQADAPALENSGFLFLDLESVERLKQNALDLLGYYRRKFNPMSLDLIQEEAPKFSWDDYKLEQKVYRLGNFAPQNRTTSMRLVLIKPRHTVGDFADTRKLADATEAAFQEIKRGMEYPVTLEFTGPYITRESEYRTITRDVQTTGIAAAILITLIMLAGFRSLRFLIYAYLPLAAGIFLTLAFTQVTIGYLNLITAFLISILFGMGSDYTLHMLVNFTGAFRTRTRLYAAVKHTYRDLRLPLFISMLTTATAFFTMTISRFEGYRHFGIIAGSGIIISFLVVFYGLPSLIVVTEKIFPQKHTEHPSPSRAVPLKGGRFILIAGILFSIFSLAVLPKAQFNYNFKDLQPKGDKLVELSDRIGKYLGVQLSPVAIVTPDRKRAKEVTEKIASYIQTHPGTTFDFAASFTTHVPKNQPEKVQILGEIQNILDKRQALLSRLEAPDQAKLEKLKRQLKAAPINEGDLPDNIRLQYEGEKQQVSVVYVYPNGKVIDGQFTTRFAKELRKLPLESDLKLAGDPMIFADVINLLERDTPRVMLVSLITVLLILFIQFRKAGHVLWVIAPVTLGFLWMHGMAYMLGLDYNFINLAILPSVLGVGIDSGIYIFDRYKLKRRSESFALRCKQTSRSVILSSLTNIAAFASLSFASHRGMASLGVLGVCGFLSCMLSAVYFIPALIAFLESRSKAASERPA